MEEYSSEDEVDEPKNNKPLSQIDTVIIQIPIKFIFIIKKNIKNSDIYYFIEEYELVTMGMVSNHMGQFKSVRWL
jgi:hypothetical protein